MFFKELGNGWADICVLKVPANGEVQVKITLGATKTNIPRIYQVGYATEVESLSFTRGCLHATLSAPSGTDSKTIIYTADYGKPTLVKRTDTGTKLREVPTLSDLDKLTNCWYYDSTNKLLYVKVRHLSEVSLEVDWRKEGVGVTPVVSPVVRPEGVEERPLITRPMTIIDRIRSRIVEIWKSILEYLREHGVLPTLTPDYLAIGLLIIGVIAIILRKYRILLIVTGVLALILLTRLI